MDKNPELLEKAYKVLALNDQGEWTIPAHGLYPHQWLWDSCFIAIGLRHYDIDRAQTELKSLLRGQWSNGMLPNMILTPGPFKRHSPEFWRSNTSIYAPANTPTSGITQPPMLAEAITRVGENLSIDERRTWYKSMYPALLSYHQWLYSERDPRGEGIIVQLHPWETGLDNTPPWMHVIHQSALPLWIKIVDKTKLDTLISLFRHDRKYALPGERLSTIDALSLYSHQRQLRNLQYDTIRILKRSKLAVQDITFNSIFLRANTLLIDIAHTIHKELPKDLLTNIETSVRSFEQLWDGYSNQYYSRTYNSKKLIRVNSIGALMPLYAGTISKERAETLVTMLRDNKYFATNYPVPSVPLNSTYFSPHTYWQGPTWINTNWLLADGLERYGYTKEASIIRSQSIKMINTHGCYEYFSPKDGSPAGAHDFSWSAALTIDFLHF